MYTTPPICTWYLRCRIVVLWIVEHPNLVGAAVKSVKIGEVPQYVGCGQACHCYSIHRLAGTYHLV